MGYSTKIIPAYGENFRGVGYFTSVKLYTGANNEYIFIGYGYQGLNNGYTSGGQSPPVPTPNLSNVIDKFPFATTANATDVGDLSIARYGGSGTSSKTNGYTAGGGPVDINVIDKFPFATNANATDVGDITESRFGCAGQSSLTHGYTSGGFTPLSAVTNTIDKFPFATNANATDVGDITVARTTGTVGQSSNVSGYNSGGGQPTVSNIIDKFPFATNANATDVGDITVARSNMTGNSSAVAGYISGGYVPGTNYSNVIDTFPFATDANATDVGGLSVSRYYSAGQSSLNFGHVSGGRQLGAPGLVSAHSNVIDKFSFASTLINASDVGDLTAVRQYVTGQQY